MAENVTQRSQFTENEIKIRTNGGFSGKRGSLSYCDLGHVGGHVEQYAHSKSSVQLSAVQNQTENSNQLATTANQLAMSVTTTSNSAIPQIKNKNFLTTYIHRVFDHCKVITFIKLIKFFFFTIFNCVIR